MLVYSFPHVMRMADPDHRWPYNVLTAALLKMKGHPVLRFVSLQGNGLTVKWLISRTVRSTALVMTSPEVPPVRSLCARSAALRSLRLEEMALAGERRIAGYVK